MKFKTLASIIFFLGFLTFAIGQTKKGVEISVSGLNHNQDLVWFEKGDYAYYNDKTLTSNLAFQFEINRTNSLGKANRGFFVFYGPSVLYYDVHYEEPLIDPFYGFLMSPKTVRTTQVYLGINVGLNKDFNLGKRQRQAMLKPFVRVNFKSYYGVVSNQIMQPLNGDPTFKEQITAANNFLLLGEMNVGLKVFFSKNHKNALDIFLPLSMNIKPSSSLSPFYQVGFAGLRYSRSGKKS